MYTCYDDDLCELLNYLIQLKYRIWLEIYYYRSPTISIDAKDFGGKSQANPVLFILPESVSNEVIVSYHYFLCATPLVRILEVIHMSKF